MISTRNTKDDDPERWTFGIPLAVALFAVAGLTASPLVGTAGGHAGADTFTIEPRESGCPDGDLCFVATEGDPANISAGDQVTIIFQNPSSNDLPHNIHVALIGDADGENTEASAAFANTDDIDPGEETRFTFQVPSGSPGVYIWCDVGAHEARGMSIELPFGGDGGQNGSPSLPGVAVMVGLAAVALAARRR